jgi:hypothetical protein
MKILLLLSMMVLAFGIARADDPIKQGDENPKTYSIDKFSTEVGVTPVQDQLVCIKFNYRSSDVVDGDNGQKTGTLASKEPGHTLDVVIPPDGILWFKKLPASVDPAVTNIKSLIVYARVTVDTDGKAVVRVVGNEVLHDDFKGDIIVWHVHGSN